MRNKKSNIIFFIIITVLLIPHFYFVACETFATSKAVSQGSFRDNGAIYTVEDTAGYKKEMKIYAIFMHRASGTRNSKDRYGDAVLIESNGKYLLMDTGTNTPIKNSTKVHTSSLVNTLKSIGVTNLDVYISHMHGDHTGGLENVCKAFNVEHLFLPDIETCKNYYTPDTHKSIDEIYVEKTGYAKKYGTDIVYLSPSFRNSRAKNTVNKFNVGAAICTVLGPVGTYSPSQFKAQDGDCGTKEGHCLNNCSLTTKIQCGNIKYLTAGDIERQEETKLSSKYGTLLNSDIMKISHHGLDTSNTTSFLGKITPFLSFEDNHGYGESSIYSSVKVAKKYGYNVATATRKYSFVVTATDDKIRIYRDSGNNGIKNQSPVKGWVSVNGRLQFYSSAKGLYRGWKTMSNGKHYFSNASAFQFTGRHTLYGTKCKFSQRGVLISPQHPSRVVQYKPASISEHRIKITWKKALRTSKYIVYRSTKKSKGYVPIAVLSSKARSYKDNGYQNGGTGLNVGKNYYYKVRAYRSFAETTRYGSYSKVRYAKVK